MSDNQLNNKRIAKNSVFLSIRMVLVLVISFYSTRVLLSQLGVSDYGVYNVVCGFVTMFAFLNSSMSNGIQRFYNFEYGKNGPEGAKRVFNTGLLIQILLAISVLAIVEPIGIWYVQNKMVIPADRIMAANWIFQFAVVSFVCSILQAPFSASVIAHEKMDFYAAISIFDAIAKLVIVLFLDYLEGDALIWYGFLWMLITVLNWIVYVVYTRCCFTEIRLKYYSHNELMKSMLSFSGWNMFGSFSGVMKEQGISLVLNLYFGPIVNAARGVASQVNAGLEGFVYNITTPARPQIVQSYAKGDLRRTMSLTYSISKLSSFFFILISLPVIIEANFVLGIWLGDNVPEHTNAFVIIILINTLVATLNSSISTVVHASGVMRNFQLTNSILGVATVPIAFVLLHFGCSPESAILTTLVSKVIAQYFSIVILNKIVSFPLKDYMSKVIMPIIWVLLISVPIPFFLHSILEYGFIRFLSVGATACTAVIASSYYTGLNSGEREILRNMLSVLVSKMGKH